MHSNRFSPSFADKTDFENASKGFIDSLKPCIVKATDGRIIWNNEDYSFLHDVDCPTTADPKLWRQGQLNSIQGLFEVTSGIYQVRGFDISNMTIAEGEHGIIVIDPLTSVECATAALALYQKHRGNRRVTGLIYSHSHVDHFGGAMGVLPTTSQCSVPIIAPEGFSNEATSENVYLGAAMRRRAAYMYGMHLLKSPEGQIGCGLGMAVSSGSTSFVQPNMIIHHTGQMLTVDGVRIEFQMVPDTEAPAEMNFYFPEQRALCIAECATHCFHNIVTLRGAPVRDAKAWSRLLDETLVLFDQKSDVLFASHNWPTWGQENISTLVSEQRDLYGYLHDQTVRMMNLGMTGEEIAEEIVLPPALQMSWHTQGYYGSVSHNVKGIYQRYMGWFDGNPAHLWEHPSAENSKRYISCMGGVEEVVKKAVAYADSRDLRFAATLLGHAVAAEPTHIRARTALASVFGELGRHSENGTWRNFYLSAAQDMHFVNNPDVHRQVDTNISRNLSMDQLLTILSVRLEGPKAAHEAFVIDMCITDTAKWWRLILSNGVLTYRSAADQNDFVGVLSGRADIKGKKLAGDTRLLFKMLSWTMMPGALAKRPNFCEE